MASIVQQGRTSLMAAPACSTSGQQTPARPALLRNPHGWARPSGRSAARRHAAALAIPRAGTPSTQHMTAAAAAAAARPDGEDGGKAKALAPVRPVTPCDKPLPLANTLEVQRLLYLLEAPDYVMRSFREHGVNGQDLLSMREEDMDDGRFRFPKHVQRKVLRVAMAWRTFQSISGNPTQGFITMPEYVAYYSYGKSPEARHQLEAAYHMVDSNGNGILTFEEFLVGFSLLDAALAEARRPPPRIVEQAGNTNWFQL